MFKDTYHSLVDNFLSNTLALKIGFYKDYTFTYTTKNIFDINSLEHTKKFKVNVDVRLHDDTKKKLNLEFTTNNGFVDLYDLDYRNLIIEAYFEYNNIDKKKYVVSNDDEFIYAFILTVFDSDIDMNDMFFIYEKIHATSMFRYIKNQIMSKLRVCRWEGGMSDYYYMVINSPSEINAKKVDKIYKNPETDNVFLIGYDYYYNEDQFIMSMSSFSKL